jgi:hypothetical protein
MRLGILAFIVPFAFCYDPSLLLQGTALQNLAAVAGGTTAALALGFAMEGYLAGLLSLWQRGIFLLAGLACLTPLYTLRGAGIALTIAGMVLFWGKGTKQTPQTPAQAAYQKETNKTRHAGHGWRTSRWEDFQRKRTAPKSCRRHEHRRERRTFGISPFRKTLSENAFTGFAPLKLPGTRSGLHKDFLSLFLLFLCSTQLVCKSPSVSALLHTLSSTHILARSGTDELSLDSSDKKNDNAKYVQAPGADTSETPSSVPSY